MTDSPLVLAFDTSAPHCAAALMRGGELITSRFDEMARGQAERLMPLLEEVLEEGGASWQSLSAIGVGIGPGNFTGIRISVAAARGLALGLDFPAVGVSQFQALACGYETPVVCSVAAPRDRIYLQTLNDGTGSDPAFGLLDDLPLPHPKAEAAVIGAQAEAIAERAGGRILQPRYPLAEAIARVTLQRMRNVSLPAPAPLYIRPADAAPSKLTPPTILPETQP